ncbi:MAG: M12 family metallo-peptidase [Saprospiraceae bacterium]|nr:M12 family metallo-peptidase [Saprospiraceae bacterium]
MTKRLILFKLIVIVAFLLSFNSTSWSQSNDVKIEADKESDFAKSDSTPYELYKISLKKKDFQNLNQEDYIKFKLKLGDKNWNVKLFEINIVAPEYSKQLHQQGISTPTTFEGTTKKGGKVRLTINDDFIYGYLEENGEKYFIEPGYYFLKDIAKDIFAVYNANDSTILHHQNENASLTCANSLPIIKGHEKNLKKNISDKLTSKNAEPVCRVMNIAIASDHTMFERYGSIQRVHNHNIGVMNNVQADFDGTGEDPFLVDLEVVAEYFSETPEQNPYNTTGEYAAIMLSEFSFWANGEGFGTEINVNESFSLAQLWTAKSMTINGEANVIGLAFTPGNFSIVEDYLGTDQYGSAWQLRILAAHEMAHNLGAYHDFGNCSDNGLSIMWPCLKGNTSNWSPQSINSIQNNLNQRGLSNCEGNSCTNGVKDIGEVGIDCGGVCPTDCCNNGILDNGETEIDCGGPNCDSCPCSEDLTFESPLFLNIQFDDYPIETSWDIRSSDQSIIYSGSNYSHRDPVYSSTIGITDLELNESNGYTLNFYDSVGDGICCYEGDGAFVLYDNRGRTIASGGEFQFRVSYSFCINNEDPCNNGIQDINEEAADCGGQFSEPCIQGCMDQSAHDYNPEAQISSNSCETCFDGIKNGDEVSIDCGGQLCVPCTQGCMDDSAHNFNPDAVINNEECETCFDGILNGDEVRVDC